MELVDLLNLCRLCRANSETATLVDIFEQREREEWQGELEPSLTDMIQLISDNYVIAPEDALPQKICLSCILAVVDTFRFKRMCEESHMYFSQLLSEMQSRIKQEPDNQQEEVEVNQKCHQVRESDGDGVPLKQTKMLHTPEKKKKSHICSDCGKVFKGKGNLTRHMLIHTGERPFKCPMCPRDYNQSAHLSIHMRQHSTERSYKCNLCPKDFKRKDYLAIHLRAHERITLKSQKLDTDETKKAQKKTKSYNCPICHKDFKQRLHLKVHLRTHKRKKISKFGDSQEMLKLRICPTCGKVFSRLFNLKRHMLRHAGEPQNDKEQMEKPSQLVEETTMPDEVEHINYQELSKLHICPTCGKAFRKLFNLNRHMLRHAGEPQHDKDQIQESPQLVEETPTPHKAEHNGSQQMLKLRICPTCGKVFTKKFNLDRHMVLHTGERPFKCNKCPKTFSQRQHLNGHLEKHINIEKPFKCTLCGKSFSTHVGQRIHNLRMHMSESDTLKDEPHLTEVICPDVDIKIEPTSIEGENSKEIVEPG